MRGPIRVLLVDDVPSVRRALQMRLGREPDLEIVGKAADGEGAVELARALCPDVVLLDVVLPGQDGFATAVQLRTAAPRSAVVMLSLHDDPLAKARATDAGAMSLVGKHEPVSALLSAIRAAVNVTGPVQ